MEAAQAVGRGRRLQGPDTVVASPDGRVGFAPPAPAWLASAGTGDVLAGMIAALRARGLHAFEAACAAVWLHGRAAEIAGPEMIADDLADAIPAGASPRCERADRPHRGARRRRDRERPACAVRRARRRVARRRRARAGPAPPGAAMPSLSRMRRLPAPACRRRGLSRLSRRRGSRGALAQHELDDRDSRSRICRRPGQPAAGDVAGAEGRAGRGRSASTRQKSHQIVDMRECHILRPELFALVAPLRRAARRAAASRSARPKSS